MRPLSVPKTPTGAKRPADVIGNAVHVMRVLTGQVEERPSKQTPGRAVGGKAGGKARAETLSVDKRKEIAKKAASARWKKS
jgi:hypothetical protein